MASITVRNIPDAVHRALRARAAKHGRSTEAEVRVILEQAARPEGRLKIGSLLASFSHKAGPLSETEVESINGVRDKRPAKPMDFE